MANATNTTLGDIQLAGDLAGNNNALAPELTSTGVTAGAYTIPHLTVDAKGRITSASNGTNAEITALVPMATDTTYGIVKIGDNILWDGTAGYVVINFNGVLLGASDTGLVDYAGCISVIVTQTIGGLETSKTITISGALADTITNLITNFNAAVVAAGLSVTLSLSSGNLVLTTPVGSGNTVTLSSDNLFANITGYVSVLANVTGTGDGTISIAVASDSVAGVVKIGSGISINNGVISFGADSIANATTSSKGIVQVGTNIDVSSGVISVKTASASDKGIASIGDGLVVTNGVVSFSYDDASPTTKGLVQVVEGNGLTISNGVVSMAGLSFNDATTSTKGIVMIGNGISVSSGVISADFTALPLATTTTKGTVIVGDGLAVSSGTLTLDRTSYATSGTAGLVKVGTSFSIASGVLDVNTANIANKNVANTYTKAQTVALYTLTDAATIAADLSQSNVFIVTLAGNRTFGTPTNPVIGGQYTIILKQDGIGSRTITWPGAFKFRLNQNTTLSTAAGAYDVLSATYVSSGLYLCDLVKGF